jgi:hypothetical protein
MVAVMFEFPALAFATLALSLPPQPTAEIDRASAHKPIEKRFPTFISPYFKQDSL